MANVGPSNWYCGSVHYAAVTAWSAGASVAAGALRRPTAPSVGNERVFVALNAGTSHATTEPTWPTTKGGTVVDNSSITWMEVTGQPGVNGDDASTPTWAAQKAFSNAVTVGFIIKDNSSTALQICTTAGNIGSSQPSFSTTPGNTTNDGTAVWTCIQATASYGLLAAPHARLVNAMATNWAAAGNAILVPKNSAAAQSSTVTLTGGTLAAPIYVVCFDHTTVSSLPPAASDVTTGATESTTGGSHISICTGGGANLDIDGVELSAGSGASTANIGVGASGQMHRLAIRNGKLKLGNTSASSLISVATNAGTRGGYISLSNTPMEFGAAGQSCWPVATFFEWTDTPNAIQGTVPTTLFAPTNSAPIFGVIRGVDLSAAGSGKKLFGVGANPSLTIVDVIGCKIDSAVTLADTPGVRGSRITFWATDSAGNNHALADYKYEGTLSIDTGIVRTEGASNGQIGTAWKIVPTANALWAQPYVSPPIRVWNPPRHLAWSPGDNLDVRLHCLINAAAIPDNATVWLETEYFGSASSPLLSRKSDGKANILASATTQTADSTSDWTGEVDDRANGEAVTTGQVRRVASNPGRVFFVTTGGTLSGSEPAGYASAVDGGSVSDGTATLRAGCRFTLDVTLTSPAPQMQGPLHARVHAAGTTAAIYVDPRFTLS